MSAASAVLYPRKMRSKGVDALSNQMIKVKKQQIAAVRFGA